MDMKHITRSTIRRHATKSRTCKSIATDAEILMDEAFSALDPLIRSEMQNILLDLQSELHKTIIFITILTKL